MGSVAFISGHKPLLRHDLHLLENGRVASGSLFVQVLMHVTNGAWSSPPEDVQDLQLTISRSRIHALHYTKIIVEWSKNLRFSSFSLEVMRRIDNFTGTRQLPTTSWPNPCTCSRWICCASESRLRLGVNFFQADRPRRRHNACGGCG